MEEDTSVMCRCVPKISVTVTLKAVIVTKKLYIYPLKDVTNGYRDDMMQ